MTSDKERSIFYRGEDNKVHVYEWVNSSIGWQHSWIGGQNAPTYQNVALDMKFGGNSLFYVGNDSRVHIYYKNGQDQWTHDWIEASWQAPSINNAGGSLAVFENGHVIYCGGDDKLHTYYWIPPVQYRLAGNGNDVHRNVKSYEVAAFPNPTDGSVTMSFEDLPDGLHDVYANVSVFDILGRSVIVNKGVRIQDGKCALNMERLPVGNYVVIIESELSGILGSVVLSKI